MDQNAGDSKAFANRNKLLVEAVRRLKNEMDGLEPTQLDFASEAVSITDSKIKELKAAIGAHLVLDCLPPIPPGDKPKSVHVALPDADHRLLSIMLSDLPGLPQKTISDLVRTFVHIVIIAVDEVRTIEHPGWRALCNLYQSTYEREGRRLQEKGLQDAAYNLWLDLREYAAQDRWSDAFDKWLQFYQQAESFPYFLRSQAMKVLEELPIAREVSFRFKELLPEGFKPPESAPNPLSLNDESGLFVVEQDRMEYTLYSPRERKQLR